MAGRKPIFDREEQRKNQVVVPMSEQEKKRVQDAANAEDRSVASFVRMVLNEHLRRRKYDRKGVPTTSGNQPV